MSNSRIVFVALTIFSTASFGESSIKIGDNSKDLAKTKQPKAAIINYSNPDEGESIYNVQVGALYEFSKWENLEGPFNDEWTHAISATLDVSRKSKEVDEVNTSSFGLQWDWFANDKKDSYKVYAGNAGIRYKQDEVEDIGSIVLNAEFAPHKWIGGDYGHKGPLGMLFFYSATGGIGYEKVVDTGDVSVDDGRNTRLYLDGQLVAYPFYAASSEAVEFTVDGQYGSDLSATGAYEAQDKNWRHYTVSLNYYPTCSKSFSVGVDYFKGENRMAGEEDRSEATIGLKFRYPAKAITNCSP